MGRDRSVTFYMPELDDRHDLDGVDPDRDHEVFGQASFITVGQTYVRLRQAGLPVRLTNLPVSEGIVVMFLPNLGIYLSQNPNSRALLVCMQVDRTLPQRALADVLLCHNGVQADGRRRRFVPNWIQGGIVPRDPARGTTIRNVVFKGRLENLHPDLRSERWFRYLRERELRFVVDCPGTMASAHTYEPGTLRWNDYSSADLVLAVRPDVHDPQHHKPAVKLVNAWSAGVPALLGPESAYRELWHDDLDYVEVSSLESAMEAIDALVAAPDRYHAMIERGRLRAEEFSNERLVQRWSKLLFEELPMVRSNPLRRALRPGFAAIRRVMRGAEPANVDAGRGSE